MTEDVLMIQASAVSQVLYEGNLNLCSKSMLLPYPVEQQGYPFAVSEPDMHSDVR